MAAAKWAYSLDCKIPEEEAAIIPVSRNYNSLLFSIKIPSKVLKSAYVQMGFRHVPFEDEHEK